MLDHGYETTLTNKYCKAINLTKNNYLMTSTTNFPHKCIVISIDHRHLAAVLD